MSDLREKLIELCAHEYAVSILDFESEIEDIPHAILDLLGLTTNDIRGEIKKEVTRLGLQYYDVEELEEIIESYPGVL